MFKTPMSRWAVTFRKTEFACSRSRWSWIIFGFLCVSPFTICSHRHKGIIRYQGPGGRVAHPQTTLGAPSVTSTWSRVGITTAYIVRDYAALVFTIQLWFSSCEAMMRCAWPSSAVQVVRATSSAASAGSLPTISTEATT